MRAAREDLSVRRNRLPSTVHQSPRASRKWLGRKDSNLRIRGPKSRALPLGHAPSLISPGPCVLPGRASRRGSLCGPRCRFRRHAPVGMRDTALRSGPKPRGANGKCIRWGRSRASRAGSQIRLGAVTRRCSAAGRPSRVVQVVTSRTRVADAAATGRRARVEQPENGRAAAGHRGVSAPRTARSCRTSRDDSRVPGRDRRLQIVRPTRARLSSGRGRAGAAPARCASSHQPYASCVLTPKSGTRKNDPGRTAHPAAETAGRRARRRAPSRPRGRTATSAPRLAARYPEFSRRTRSVPTTRAAPAAPRPRRCCRRRARPASESACRCDRDAARARRGVRRPATAAAARATRDSCVDRAAPDRRGQIANGPRTARERQRVVQRHRLERRAQLVVAVGADAEHAKCQVDLGERADAHGRRAAAHRESGPPARSSSSVIGCVPGGTVTRNVDGSSSTLMSTCESSSVRSKPARARLAISLMRARQTVRRSRGSRRASRPAPADDRDQPPRLGTALRGADRRVRPPRRSRASRRRSRSPRRPSALRRRRAAGQRRAQIGGAQRHTGHRARAPRRTAVLEDALVARQQQRRIAVVDAPRMKSGAPNGAGASM